MHKCRNSDYYSQNAARPGAEVACILRKFNAYTVNMYLKRIRSGPTLTWRQRHLIPVATHILGSIGIGTRRPLKVARKFALTDCRTHPAHR